VPSGRAELPGTHDLGADASSEQPQEGVVDAPLPPGWAGSVAAHEWELRLGCLLGTVALSVRRLCGRAGGSDTNRGDDMNNDRHLVGIDLGIASAHTVRVLDGASTTVAKRKAYPTVESLGGVETVAMAGCETRTRLEVVVKPTGPAWLPIAVFFAARGHLVFRVSSAKAADLRRFSSRHTKTNDTDADTLARLPLFDPAGLQPLELPGPERAALDRRVRGL
jgi:hypothetical protein